MDAADQEPQPKLKIGKYQFSVSDISIVLFVAPEQESVALMSAFMWTHVCITRRGTIVHHCNATHTIRRVPVNVWAAKKRYRNRTAPFQNLSSSKRSTECMHALCKHPTAWCRRKGRNNA